eukprot:gene14641-biopygen3643
MHASRIAFPIPYGECARKRFALRLLTVQLIGRHNASVRSPYHCLATRKQLRPGIKGFTWERVRGLSGRGHLRILRITRVPISPKAAPPPPVVPAPPPGTCT